MGIILHEQHFTDFKGTHTLSKKVEIRPGTKE